MPPYDFLLARLLMDLPLLEVEQVSPHGTFLCKPFFVSLRETLLVPTSGHWGSLCSGGSSSGHCSSPSRDIEKHVVSFLRCPTSEHISNVHFYVERYCTSSSLTYSESQRIYKELLRLAAFMDVTYSSLSNRRASKEPTCSILSYWNSIRRHMNSDVFSIWGRFPHAPYGGVGW